MDRSQYLQLMRFVAAALVLCTHVTFYTHERIDPAVSIWHFGEVGVPIFFVISGIVMVVSTRDMPLDAGGARLFMTRRLIRIVPLWWVALSVKIAIGLMRPDLVNHNHVEFEQALKSLFFIPYFNDLGAVVPLHGVGWTLLHEMFFYLLFALAMLLGRRPALLTSGVILLLWFLGSVVQLQSPFWIVATHTSNLHFVLGMLVGSALLWERTAPRRALPWALVALTLAAGVAGDRIDRGYVAIFAFAASVLWLARGTWPRWTSPLTRLGDSSYSLYLFHPFLAPGFLLLIDRLAPELPVLVLMTVVVGLSIVAAHLLHLIVENPVVSFARARISSAKPLKRRPAGGV